MTVTCGYGFMRLESVFPLEGVQCPAYDHENGKHCTAILPPIRIWREGTRKYVRAMEILPRCKSSVIIECPNPDGLKPHQVVVYTAYNPENPALHDKICLQAVADFGS